MTQEKANKIFETELGLQLNEIFVTSDDRTFIRREEAENYCHDILEEGDDVKKYSITVWYPNDTPAGLAIDKAKIKKLQNDTIRPVDLLINFFSKIPDDKDE